MNSVKTNAMLLSLPIIFALSLAIYLKAPTVQFTDSKCSLWLSQALVSKQSFRIDSIIADELKQLVLSSKLPLEVRMYNGHLHYYFPNATPFLTAPFVAVMNAFGIRAADDQGIWDPDGEIRIQRYAASIITALCAVMVFLIASRFLPLGYCWLVSLTAAFATQFFSIMSRSLWSHDWGTLFLLFCIYLLIRAREDARINPWLLATLVSWLYFIRPSHNINVIAISIIVMICHRDRIIPYVSTGITWLALFIFYSKYNFGTLLPEYFLPKGFGEGITPSGYITAIFGNLVSPSRGMLIFSPFWIAVIYLAVRFRKQLVHRPLAITAAAVSVIHLFMVSGSFANWWGGHTYGPRIMTDILPWLFLLFVLSLHAWRESSMEVGTASVSMSKAETLIVGFVLTAGILFGVFTHGSGALYQNAHGWNVSPVNVDRHPERLWEWSDPQFLRR